MMQTAPTNTSATWLSVVRNLSLDPLLFRPNRMPPPLLWFSSLRLTQLY